MLSRGGELHRFERRVDARTKALNARRLHWVRERLHSMRERLCACGIWRALYAFAQDGTTTTTTTTDTTVTTDTTPPATGAVTTTEVTAPATDTSAVAVEEHREDERAIHVHRLHLGVRAAYAIPLGKLGGDTNLKDAVNGMIPIQVDVGYFITPHWMLGGYASYGFVRFADTLCGDVDCSGHDWRFGAQFQYHFGAEMRANPWLGVGGNSVFGRS